MYPLPDKPRINLLVKDGHIIRAGNNIAPNLQLNVFVADSQSFDEFQKVMNAFEHETSGDSFHTGHNTITAENTQ